MSDDHSLNIPEPSMSERQRAARLGFISIAILGCILAIGSVRVLLIRQANAETLRAVTENQQKTFVAFTLPSPSGSDGSRTIQLPGTLAGNRETMIYARATGYVRNWTHDIGSRVKQGEILAEIETPELDRQMEQARANLRQSNVALQLAKQTLQRWEQLRKDELVTEQDLIERRASVDQLSAAQNASQAEASRLESLRSFQKVEAPFTGVITSRNVEIGKLVMGTPSSNDQSLFGLAMTDPLKLVVYVPQTYIAQVKVGMTVEVSQSELGGERLKAQVARTANAIDPATRTLRVEMTVNNHDGKLLPGAYAQASFPIGAGQILSVPANCLLFRSEGPRVAVVDDKGHIHLAPITLGRDLGKTIEIVAGIKSTDHIVLNPPDSLAEGDHVEAKAAVKPPAPGAK
jgi:RND family efflux transporter MFP subunit